MKKNLLYFILIGLLLAILSSCSSYQTFSVKGTPGTIIRSPNNQQLGVIGNTGETKITLRRKDGYYHYLQAYVPGSSVFIPFALDYQNKKNIVRDYYQGLGYVLAGVGVIAELASIPMVAQDSENEFALGMCIGGAGVSLLGLGIWELARYKGGRIKHEYAYQKFQTTNTDIVNAHPQLGNVEYKSMGAGISTVDSQLTNANTENKAITSDAQSEDSDDEYGWVDEMFGDEYLKMDPKPNEKLFTSFDYFIDKSGKMIAGKYEFNLEFKKDIFNLKVTATKKGSTTATTICDFHIQELSYNIDDDWIMIGFVERNTTHTFLFQKNYLKPAKHSAEDIWSGKSSSSSFYHVSNRKEIEASVLTAMLFNDSPSERFYEHLKKSLVSYKGNCKIENVKDKI